MFATWKNVLYLSSQTYRLIENNRPCCTTCNTGQLHTAVLNAALRVHMLSAISYDNKLTTRYALSKSQQSLLQSGQVVDLENMRSSR
jgi:hypothetical protein